MPSTLLDGFRSIAQILHIRGNGRVANLPLFALLLQILDTLQGFPVFA